MKKGFIKVYILYNILQKNKEAGASVFIFPSLLPFADNIKLARDLNDIDKLKNISWKNYLNRR